MEYMKSFLILIFVLMVGCHAHQPWQLRVQPDLETAAVNQAGDAADDPALWVHTTEPERSLILGTQKKQGLYSYALDGQIKQFIPAGRLNNVDIRQGINHLGQQLDVAAASNRSNNQISLFLINDSGDIKAWDEIAVPTSSLAEVYGFCLGYVQNQLLLVMTGKDRDAELYVLNSAAQRLDKLRMLEVPSQSEGCVIDDDSGDIFIGEEAAGVWRFHWQNSAVRELVIQVDGAYLQADVEGLALLRAHGHPYLMVSSQGNSQFPIYDLTDYRHVKNVVVKGNKQFDAVTGTDGIDINQRLVTNAFPQGVLMVQDDRNTAPRAHQNFKVISLAKIIDQLLQ